MLSSKGCPQTLDQTSFPKKDQRPGELKTKRAPKRALNTSAFLRGQVAGCGTSRTDNHSLSVGSACRREFNVPSKVETPNKQARDPRLHAYSSYIAATREDNLIPPASTPLPARSLSLRKLSPEGSTTEASKSD